MTAKKKPAAKAKPKKPKAESADDLLTKLHRILYSNPKDAR